VVEQGAVRIRASAHSEWLRVYRFYKVITAADVPLALEEHMTVLPITAGDRRLRRESIGALTMGDKSQGAVVLGRMQDSPPCPKDYY
jgi:hypothetical protein